ncbi:hypothetical protein ACHAWO_011293 [Cyclotella atomus]|uniref:Uncharacterized protein n=1 Tax=Cyclotella atomus TaxID=382360 RepID=A0ABD3N0Y4_9STRA
MPKPLGPLLVLSVLTSQQVDCLRSPRSQSLRRLSTKYCGTDALSAYLSCTASTSCLESEDCNEGESCYEVNCPILSHFQFNLTSNETLSNETSTSSTVDSNFTTAANATTTTVMTTAESDIDNFFNTEASNETETLATDVTDTTPASTDVLDNVSPVPIKESEVITTPNPMSVNDTETISITIVNENNTDDLVTASPTISYDPTAAPTNPTPTISPSETYENWTNFDYSEYTRFCGPKVVGGYDIAVSQCGPLTVCGVNVTSTHYGSSGNDCPEGNMCYSDIACGNGPGPDTTTTPSSTETVTTSIIADTTTINTTEIAEEIMNTTTSSSSTATSEITTNEVPTTTESITTTTTTPYNPVLLTTRAAFCGSFYAEAVLNCGTKTMCTSSNNCDDEEECFENVSCTYDPNVMNDDVAEEEGDVETASLDKNDDSNQVDWTEDLNEDKEEDISFAQNESDNAESNSASTVLVSNALIGFFVLCVSLF